MDYERAIQVVQQHEFVNEQTIQRRLAIPYRAAKEITEKLAENGMLGEPVGDKGYRLVLTQNGRG